MGKSLFLLHSFVMRKRILVIFSQIIYYFFYKSAKKIFCNKYKISFLYLFYFINQISTIFIFCRILLFHFILLSYDDYFCQTAVSYPQRNPSKDNTNHQKCVTIYTNGWSNHPKYFSKGRVCLCHLLSALIIRGYCGVFLSATQHWLSGWSRNLNGHPKLPDVSWLCWAWWFFPT